MEKNSGTPINTKKIFMLWPKKNSYKEFDNDKKFLRLENSPPPPHNFCNGPSLKGVLGLLPYEGNTLIPNISS